MAILLSGSPAPAPRPALVTGKDLISGDSSTFAASNGSWANAGGTLTWDSTAANALPGRTGSLKFVTTAGSQSINLPLSGTFKAGVTYHARLAIFVEETSVPAIRPPIYAQFGAPGVGDYRMGNLANDSESGTGVDVAKNAIYFLLSWTPSADRSSGVFIVVGRSVMSPTDSTDTCTVHVCEARLMAVAKGEVGLLLGAEYNGGAGVGYPGLGLIAPVPLGTAGVSIGAGFPNGSYGGPGLSIDGDGIVFLSPGDQDGQLGISPGYVWLYAVHNNDPGASVRPPGEVDFEFGYDWVGIQMGEVNDTTVGISPDYGRGYDVNLIDRGYDGRHWQAVGVDGSTVRLAKAMESPFEGAGDLLVGTTRAAQVGPSASSHGTGIISLATTPSTEDRFYLSGLQRQSTFAFDSPISGSVTFHYDIWLSQTNGGGAGTGCTVRLRRDSKTGAVLASHVFDGAEGNHTDGHQVEWTGTYVDAAPTTGIYCLTMEPSTANATYHAFTDTFIAYFTADVFGPGARLAKGADDTVLHVDTATHAVAWRAPRIIAGTADPTAGGGVAAAVATLYTRDNGGVGELWLKTGAGGTAWTQIT